MALRVITEVPLAQVMLWYVCEIVETGNCTLELITTVSVLKHLLTGSDMVTIKVPGVVIETLEAAEVKEL